MQRLANLLAVLHDIWRFGYVPIEIRALVCGILCGLLAVQKAVVERVHWSCSLCREKIWTRVCAELGSIFELEHDLRCFEHVLTHSNRLVWFVLSETDVLKSRSDLPSPLAIPCEKKAAEPYRRPVTDTDSRCVMPA